MLQRGRKKHQKTTKNSPPQQTELKSSRLFLKYRRAFQTGIGQLKIKASTCYFLLKLLRKKKNIQNILLLPRESLQKHLYIHSESISQFELRN